MSPEYGATAGFFPVDAETLAYLRFTNRPPDLIKLVEAYCKEQGHLPHGFPTPDPQYSDTVDLDLATVTPSMAGPKRPQDRINLPDVKKNFETAFGGAHKPVTVAMNGGATIDNGSVVIAAITSCTNTSNPSVMIGAGLLAKKAVERGLKSKPWVKTSLAPGSKVVSDYYREAGLTPYLEPAGISTWCGYGYTDLHRQQRTAARTGVRSGAERKPDCGGGVERQSKFRRPHQCAGESQLPGVAAAGGGVCAGWTCGYRSDYRASGRGLQGLASVFARHLAHRFAKRCGLLVCARPSVRICSSQKEYEKAVSRG